MSTERASRAIIALEALNKLMDLYQEYEKEVEEPRYKKRKVYVKYKDIESQILKGVAWNSDECINNAFICISMDDFEDIFSRLKSQLDKNHLVNSKPSYRMRLAFTLRYLIKGSSYRTLEKICHESRKSIAKIVPHMLGLLIYMMEDEYLKLPSTQSQWSSVVNDFEKYWQFPHTLGVLDVKHFCVNLSSFVLLSIIDASGRFLYTEIIECDEETNESAIYINSKLYNLLQMNTQQIPAEQPLKGQTVKTDYYFVGAEVFGSDRYVLKEYHESCDLKTNQKVFNYRLNRVRLVEKMAFDALFYRFKIFERLDHLDKYTVRLIIKACCLIHNYLTQQTDKINVKEEDINNVFSPIIVIPLAMQFFEKYEKSYQRIENVCNYCVDEGDIPQQWNNVVKKD